jgi:hypothetical protein
MLSRKLNRLLAAFGFALLTVSVNAQTGTTWTEWQKLQPEGEEFSVSMPKSSTSESTKFPYHKMEITARLYLASAPNGPVLAVASFNGIKANPTMYTEFQRFNSYVDAFKTFFPSKVRPKEAVVKLTQIGNNTFHGYSGREYRMSIGDLSGTVFAYATKKRFYTIVSLNTKKDDALQEKFLSSFYLPDKPTEVTTTVASSQEANEPKLPDTPANPNEPKPEGNPTAVAVPNVAAETNSDQPAAPTAPNNQSPTPTARDNATPQGRAPIQGGVLNGKAIYLPLPDVPPGDATGTVMVQVLVDEQGSVVAARAVSGPAQLQPSAVAAARLARFTATMLMGEPVKVSGTLVYNFVR